ANQIMPYRLAHRAKSSPKPQSTRKVSCRRAAGRCGSSSRKRMLPPKMASRYSPQRRARLLPKTAREGLPESFLSRRAIGKSALTHWRCATLGDTCPAFGPARERPEKEAKARQEHRKAVREEERIGLVEQLTRCARET